MCEWCWFGWGRTDTWIPYDRSISGDVLDINSDATEYVAGLISRICTFAEAVNHNLTADSYTLMAASSRQPKPNLKAIKDTPLRTRQDTQHRNSNRQSVPKSCKPNPAIDARNSLSCALTSLTLRVELRNHNVGRVRDDGAADTGNNTSGERHTELLCLVK
jgi:hypothetical protein